MGANTHRRSIVEQPDVIPLAYAGKWLAWSGDGLRMLAVGDSLEAREAAAMEAGFKVNMVAIDYVTVGRVARDDRA